jgi:hypothetical protein
LNLFVPSAAELHNGARLVMETDFPDGERVHITIGRGATRPFTLAVRRPGWTGDGFALSVNGERIAVPPVASLRVGGAGGRDLGLDDGALPPSSYVTIERTWKAGDVIEATIPKSLRLEPTPDDHRVTAIMWGPLVLAGDLGPRNDKPESAPRVEPPAFVTADLAIEKWLSPAGTRQGDFRASGARHLAAPKDPPSDVQLAPFYRTHGRTYSVYVDVLTPAEFDARIEERAAEALRLERLEQATVVYVQPGRPADEQTYHYQSEPSDRAVTHAAERTGRGGAGWFSYELPIESNVPQSLVLTYHNDLGLPVLADFTIAVDGTSIGRYAANRSATGFWDASYPIPASTIAGKSKVTVRFIGGAESRVVPVYGIRVIRAGDSR